MEKLFKVYIGTPNRMLEINGKLIRTPVEWITEESKLQAIRMKIESEAISNFSIEEVSSKNKKDVRPVKVSNPKPRTTVKKQSKKPTSILEKLTEAE